MTLKQKFPIKNGWLHLKMTLNPGCSMSEDDVKSYIEMFTTRTAPEIGHIDISRNPIVAVYREVKRAELPADDAGEDRLIREDGSDDAFIKAHGVLMDEMLAEDATATPAPCAQCGGGGWVPSKTEADTDPCPKCEGGFA